MEAGSLSAAVPSQTSRVLSDRRALHGAATRALRGRGAPPRGQSPTQHTGLQSRELQILSVQMWMKSWLIHPQGFFCFVLSLGCSVRLRGQFPARGRLNSAGSGGTRLLPETLNHHQQIYQKYRSRMKPRGLLI